MSSHVNTNLGITCITLDTGFPLACLYQASLFCQMSIYQTILFNFSNHGINLALNKFWLLQSSDIPLFISTLETYL